MSRFITSTLICGHCDHYIAVPVYGVRQGICGYDNVRTVTSNVFCSRFTCSCLPQRVVKRKMRDNTEFNAQI